MYHTYTRRPPYNCNTKYTSPLRVFGNFNSKAKTMATFDFCKIKSIKLKVARFLPKVKLTEAERKIEKFGYFYMVHSSEVR